MGFASVRLYVDNSDRRVDVDADEVVIGLSLIHICYSRPFTPEKKG